MTNNENAFDTAFAQYNDTGCDTIPVQYDADTIPCPEVTAACVAYELMLETLKGK